MILMHENAGPGEAMLVGENVGRQSRSVQAIRNLFCSRARRGQAYSPKPQNQRVLRGEDSLGGCGPGKAKVGRSREGRDKREDDIRRCTGTLPGEPREQPSP